MLHLYRLMGYHSLARTVRLGPEDSMAIVFANRLRAATLERRLSAVWVHPANELAQKGLAAAIARAAGLITGAADYLFLAADGAMALEAKSARGRMSDAQADFRQWCADSGVPFHVFRTADEGEALLRSRGWLR